MSEWTLAAFTLFTAWLTFMKQVEETLVFANFAILFSWATAGLAAAVAFETRWSGWISIVYKLIILANFGAFTGLGKLEVFWAWQTLCTILTKAGLTFLRALDTAINFSIQKIANLAVVAKSSCFLKTRTKRYWAVLWKFNTEIVKELNFVFSCKRLWSLRYLKAAPFQRIFLSFKHESINPFTSCNAILYCLCCCACRCTFNLISSQFNLRSRNHTSHTLLKDSKFHVS